MIEIHDAPVLDCTPALALASRFLSSSGWYQVTSIWWWGKDAGSLVLLNKERLKWTDKPGCVEGDHFSATTVTCRL